MTDPTSSIDRSRNPVFRTVGMLLAGACAVGIVCGSGCEYLEDKELEVRTHAQHEFEKLAFEYTILIGKVGIENEPVAIADQIDQLSRRIVSINGASASQKKTATVLAAAMNAAAGSLRAHILETIALDQAMLRERIAEGAASAMIVASGAQVRSNANFSSTRELIAQMRAGAEARRSELQEDISSMQGTLTDMQEQHRDSTQQLNKLNSDVATLRQQANDAGPFDGYPLVEEAAGVRSRSIPIKSAIAEAEIQLSNLGPDIDRAQDQHALFQAISDATDRAEDNAMQLRDAVIAAGNAGKQRAAEIVDTVKSNLAIYQEREESELKPLFDLAIGNLEKASRSAQGRGAAVMTAFNASRLAGDLWYLRADAANADAKLYEMLSRTAPLLGGNSEQWSGLAGEARNAHTAAIDNARAKYEAALERTSASGDNQTARDAVQGLLDSLDGSKIEQEPMDLAISTTRPAPAPAGGGGAGVSATMGTMGFDTPQELATFLNSLSSRQPSPELLKELNGACFTADPQIIARMDDPQAGAQMMQMMGGGMLGGPGGKLEVATIQGSQGDLVSTVAPPGAPVMKVPIIQKNGKWLLDLDTLQKRVMKMMEEMMENAVPRPPGDAGNRGGGRGGGGGGFGDN